MTTAATTETENYQYLLGLPIVSDLLKANNKLRKRNKELKRLVRLIGNNMSLLAPHKSVVCYDDEKVRVVEIKKEKIVVDVEDNDYEPNIAYEIVKEEESPAAEDYDESPAAEDDDESPAAEDDDESPAAEEEVYEITINGKSYYTTNEINGEIYGLDENGDVSLEVGAYKAGKPTFY